jgi:H+-translocating NAD(P) transhydrogenase subunit alpha
MLIPSKGGPWPARFLLVILLLLTMAGLWNAVASGSPAEAPAAEDTGGPAVEKEAAPSSAHGGDAMSGPVLIASLYILVLAGFVGFEVIGGVSPLLHTPLMSVTNAISAISLVGSLVIAGSSEYNDGVSRFLGFVAVTTATINVVGGFMITDRMLRMFKPKEGRKA